MSDYLKKLQYIDNTEISDEEKSELLDKLYAVKPVRLAWYLEKAKLLSKEDKGAIKANKILEDKYISHYNYPCVIETHMFQKTLGQDKNLAEYRDFLISRLEKNDSFVNKQVDKLLTREKTFINNEGLTLYELIEAYILCGKWITSYILRLSTIYYKDNSTLRVCWTESLNNVGYLKECINIHEKVVIYIDNFTSQNEAYILGKCLAEMGCPTYVVSVPEEIDMDVPVDLAETVPISMENASELYGFTLIPTVELIYQDKSLGNNSSHIVNAICGEDETVLVLASSRKFEELSRSPLLKNRIENLYSYQETFRTDYYAFGWCGSYLDYISQLYQMDAKEAVYRKPECKFSIVIPVRNSTATLQHTIKTCLNQRYQGDYEIVVSDNSVDGNTEVWQYCQSLKDDRIKYYKTPRNLSLSRSFEYAFLQSRGEFVFSIGADDAVLPWTLEVLEQMRDKYPEEEVILWDRGFYAWPGFNGGQENQFIIPDRYERGQYQERYVEPIAYLAEAMKNPGAMYALPMLYINSGFKRSFMKTLLKDTGRLWDGICQDIYMGTIVSVIKESILYLDYPLAIAGMSSSSIGALSSQPMVSQEKGASYTNRLIQENNVGGFSKSEIETLAPELGSDVSSLYNCILRAVNRGLMPVRYLTEVFDWKQWFLNIYSVLSKKDIYFDRKIHQMRFAAMKHGEEFLKWFDETIYEDALTPVIFNEPDNHARTYREEYGKKIVLDASTRGVHNIYEATQLFEEMTGL